jgi:hypothetical protein
VSESSSFYIVDVHFVHASSSCVSPLVYLQVLWKNWDHPTNTPNAAHMHRHVQCGTSQVPQYVILLFLDVRHWDARSATDGCAGLYGSIGHGYVAEVVLANSLDSV